MIANGAIVGAVAAVARRRPRHRRMDARRLRGRVGRQPPHRPVRPAVDADRLRSSVLAVVVATVAGVVAGAGGVAAAGDGGAVGSADPRHSRCTDRSLVALALVVGASSGSSLARASTDHVQPLLLIVGLLAVVVGAVLAAPAAIRAVGRARPAAALRSAPRAARPGPLPGPGRGCAGRHHARPRHRGRHHRRRGRERVPQRSKATCRTASCSSGSVTSGPLRIPTYAAQRAALDQRAAAVVAALGDGFTAVPLDVAFNRETATIRTFANRSRWGSSGTPTPSSPSAIRTSRRPRCSPSTASTRPRSTRRPTC